MISKVHLSADVGFIEANKYLAIACSFLLGFGDACFNTQIFSILGSAYKDNSAAAFAIFKFVQSFAAAAAFFYAQHAPLFTQFSVTRPRAQGRGGGGPVDCAC